MERREPLTINYERLIDEFEDDYVLSICERPWHDARNLAIEHANSLHVRAMTAFNLEHLDEAIWLAERETSFLCRFFGANNRYAKRSQVQLKTFQNCAEGLMQKAS